MRFMPDQSTTAPYQAFARARRMTAAFLAVACLGSMAHAEESFLFEMQIDGMQNQQLELVLYRNNDVLGTANFVSGAAAKLSVPYAMARRVTRFCVVTDVAVGHFSDGSDRKYSATCDNFDGSSLPRDPQSGYQLTYAATLYPS